MKSGISIIKFKLLVTLLFMFIFYSSFVIAPFQDIEGSSGTSIPDDSQHDITLDDYKNTEEDNEYNLNEEATEVR